MITIVASLADGRKRRERGKRAVAVVGVIVGILLVLGGAGLLYRELIKQPAVAATPVPAAATPAPTEEPPLPTPTAMLSVPEPADESEFASHFRKESDPAEVVVV